MNIWGRLRYKYICTINGLTHMKKVKNAAIKQLIGHTKIIGWEDGLPVRSLAIPAEYSETSANMTAKMYNSIRPQIKYPGLLSISVTNDCDCDCKHCYAAGQNGNDLSLDKWKSIIDEGLDLGAFSCVITGGEPLVRKDLPDLIRAVDKKRSTCLVYSNGYLLEDRVDELYDAGLRRIAVSIDYVSPEKHDEHRKKPGLFAQVMKGIAAAKKKGMLVGLSTFSSPERVENGELEKIFQFAKDNGFNEIMVYDLLPSGNLSECSRLGTNSQEYLSSLKSLITKWWDDEHAPGIWWYGHISAYNNLGCSGGSTMINISHDGKVRPCDLSRMDVGSVTEESLLALWYKLQIKADQHKTNGCQCMLQNWSKS